MSKTRGYNLLEYKRKQGNDTLIRVAKVFWDYPVGTCFSRDEIAYILNLHPGTIRIHLYDLIYMKIVETVSTEADKMVRATGTKLLYRLVVQKEDE